MTAPETVLPPGQRLLVTIVLMTATLMVALDTTIANVALPHMQAALGATSESVAWVLTSYIVATAIAIPLTGWLSARFGRRMLFTVALAGFTLSSAACGLADSLGVMVAARGVQGVAGAFLVPLSQATMYDINPRHQHARAMMLWGMAVMIAPILGPLVGGYLTDRFDWRWCFYINVPIGIVNAIAAWAAMPDGRGERQRLDLVGFVLLGVFLGSLQLLLDRGTQLDWFNSTEILIEAALGVGALWTLVVHLLTARNSIIPIQLLKDRNFTAALILITVVGGVLTAGSALLAPMLQRLLNYPVFEAGLVVVPRGVGTLAGFLLAGRLVSRIDGRLLIVAGMGLVGISLWMMTGFSLQMGQGPIISTGLIQGLGLGLAMMPMNLLAFTTLAPVRRTDAASLYSLFRSIGGSIAISTTSALLASNLQTSHADLGASLTNITIPFVSSGLIEQFGLQSSTMLQYLDLEINRQALMIAYLDDYWLMMWAAFACVPLVVLMRRQRFGDTEAVHLGE